MPLSRASAALRSRRGRGLDPPVDDEKQPLPLAKVPDTAEKKKKGITACKITLLDNLPFLDIHNLQIQKQYLAALIMYSQGFIYLWNSECNTEIMLQALVGSGLEGILVIRFLMVLFSGTSIWRKVLSSTLFLSNVFCIHGSIVFMKKTGSEEMPDMWVLMEGMKNLKAYAKSELSGGTNDEGWSLILALVFAIPSAMLIFGIGASEHATESSRLQYDRGENPRKRLIGAIGSLFLIAPSIVLYCKGAWMPVFHTYASLMGSLIFSPPGSGIELTPAGLLLQNSSKGKGPNVVFVIHESLSGGHMLTSTTYSKMMPFVEQMMHSKDEYFVFENVRTVSGDTTDAVTALQSGCLPQNHKEGRETALNTTLGTQFKARGFDTVSFSSCALVRNLKGTKWFMLENQLSANFDTVFHPHVTKDPLVNEAAQDDILMGDNFKDWLNLRQKEMALNDEEGRKPFFAQFYYFNSHYPFYNNENVSKTESRIDGMFKTVEID
ncbi:hypothetical protein QTG54_000423 [Skeletonema marinoi]|uniref:Sulfatase N-terminal domain-containing protein n=1 Tax=Skeletonema marinoi TaxID=267567 RepID=A0AAD9DJJ6_9STRA|nr:hypothetical protein QTG54_000423 [Skeletonema marinoi]